MIEQTVSSWEGWPDDVRERLRDWNRRFLLSFRVGPDFVCGHCKRQIRTHPNGNAVVRPRRKAQGVLRCEECLVTLARRHAYPPEGLAPRPIEYRLRRFIERQRLHNEKLRRQLAVDQLYIDALEDLADPEALRALRTRLRGKHRQVLP